MMFNGEDDLAAYEDELYREESSSDESIDSEVEGLLYSQVHYSQHLSEGELDDQQKDDGTEEEDDLRVISDTGTSVIVISDSDDVRVSDSSAVVILSESLEDDSVYTSKIKRKVLSSVRRPENQSTPKVSPGEKKRSKLQAAKSQSSGKRYKDGVVHEVVVIRGSSDEDDLSVEEEIFLTSDSDQSDVENWMVLGRPREDGDASIQLNLESYSYKGDDGQEWSISERDSEVHNTRFTPRRFGCRYYTDDKNILCRNCNFRGHLSKNCPQPKKMPACCLCGKRGHLQYTCPDPYCLKCFLPGHSHKDCTDRPNWQKKCYRCCMLGHYADACPEIWRQYHLTVVQGPLKKSSSASTPKNIVYCCNCGRKGHCGYECKYGRMYSTVYPSCELVFTYDENHDIKRRDQRAKLKMKEPKEAGVVTLAAEEEYYVEETVDAAQDTAKKLKKKKRKEEKKQKKAELRFTKNSLKRFKEKKKKRFHLEEEIEYFPRGRSEKPTRSRKDRKAKKYEHLLFEDFSKNERLDDRPKKGTKRCKKQRRSDIDESLFIIKQRKKKSKTAR